MKYTDIHSHILPGIDDGAADMAVSMQMLRTAAAEGIGRIILTPHHKPGRRNAPPGKVRSLIRELEEEMGKEGLEMELLAGNEIFYRQGVAELLEKGEASPLAGTGCVLVEFSPLEDYAVVRNAVYQLLAGGWQPVVAHVERYQDVCRKKERVKELADMGAYLQVNAGSIMGGSGPGAKQRCRWLLKTGRVHFVATDAHDAGRRAPRLKKCGAYLAARYGEAYAGELLYGNAEKILAGGYL